jgi:hypothetical protein
MAPVSVTLVPASKNHLLRRRFLAVVVAVAAFTGAMAGPAMAQVKPKTVTGKALLADLPVTAEHTSGYKRSKFKQWIDADGDCQDTRSEVLQQESLKKVTFYSVKDCAVSTGQWVSWYDDTTWTKASDVDIDHVVSLAEAWRSGAWDWSAARRRNFANDLAFSWTLDAVTDNVNDSKGDRDPAAWLPADHDCNYARHWVAIKYRWKLSIDSDEEAALAQILTGSCGKLKLTVPARGK